MDAGCRHRHGKELKQIIAKLDRQPTELSAGVAVVLTTRSISNGPADLGTVGGGQYQQRTQRTAHRGGESCVCARSPPTHRGDVGVAVEEVAKARPSVDHPSPTMVGVHYGGAQRALLGAAGARRHGAPRTR
jgi:hypothetical protein